MAANKALELGLDKPEVSIALGYYYLWAERDHKKALTHLNFAGNHLPNDVEILRAKAAIFEPEGNWKEYIRSLEKAIEHSPRDASNYTDLSLGLWFTRQYEKSVETCNQAIFLSPDETWAYLYKMLTIWSWKGANKESRDALKTVSMDHEWCLWSWYWQEIGEKNYKAARELLSKTPGVWVRHKVWARPKAILSAFIYDYLGKTKLANESYRTAKALLEEEIRKYPDDPRYHSTLGIAYAALGFKDRAIVEGQKAVEMLPSSKDAVYGLSHEHDLALIYTMVGDHEAAINKLEFLLSIPSWISANWIEMDIRYEPLRAHTRFQDLLNNNPRYE
jgi:tetratricopeptide (TPR) repeat protein